MRVLLTGGSGFIGRHFSNIMGDKYEIHVLGQQKDLNYLKLLNGDKIPYYYTDYSIDSLHGVMGKINPKVIVHLAAHRPDKNSNFLSDYLVNVEITSNLFEVCRNNDVTNIINISSRLVYNQELKKPWKECQNTVPMNYYGLSKKFCEITAEHFTNKGLKIKTLRLAQVVGLGEKDGYVLQIYLNNALKGKPIHIYGQGKGMRHYIYVKDAIRAIDKAINKKELSGIYNIGMSKLYSFEELATIVNNTFGKKSEIILERVKDADENIYHMDISKAQKELEWYPEYDMIEAYNDINIDLKE